MNDLNWKLIVLLILTLVLAGHGNLIAQTEPTNEAIRTLQEQLQARGYAITAVDGLLGEQTIRVFRRFQRDHHLDATAPLTAETLAEMQAILQPFANLLAFTLPLHSRSLEQNYHQLSNQDLFDQATARYQQGWDTVNAERRLLQQTLILYQQLEQANSDWQPLLASETVDSEELDLEVKIDQAQQRLAHYQQRHSDLMNELQILEQYLQQNQTTQEATTQFFNTLRELYVIVLELRLRVADGTLHESEIPNHLTKQSVYESGRALEMRLQDLQEDQHQHHQRLQELRQTTEEIKHAAFNSETLLARMREQQQQQHRRQQLQSQYQEKSSDRLQEVLAHLEDERIFLQGDFQLLLLRFHQSHAQLTGLYAALEPLPALPTPLGIGASAAELQENISQLETLITDIETRSDDLQRFNQQQHEVVELSEAFTIGATFLQEHLAKMHLLTEMLAADDQQLNPEVIEQQQSEVNQALEQVNIQLQELNEHSQQLQTRREQVRSRRAQARQYLADLQQTLESTQQAQEWEQQLTELDAEALVERFQNDATDLQALHDRLAAQQQKISESNQEQDVLHNQLHSLSDPLIRRLRPRIQAEQQRIQRRLHALSGLDEPAEVQTQQATEEQIATQESADTVQPLPDRQRFADDAEGLRHYQSVVANRQQYLRDQERSQARLLAALEVLESEKTEYIQMLTDLHRLSLQQYATSVEIKKQLGRGHLTPEQTPEGLIQALRREPITALEQEIAQRINQRTHLRLRIAQLNGHDTAAPEEIDSEEESADESKQQASAQSEQYDLFDRLQTLVGQRLELLADLAALEAERLQIPDAFGDGERLQQQAENRMRSGSSLFERVLGVLPSDRAVELTELLRNNYITLLLIEAQRALLATENEKVTELIQLVQNDQQMISDMLPMLQEQLATVELEQDRIWTQIRAQLDPDAAATIIAEFTERTGKQLERTPPLLEQDQAEFIERAQRELTALHVQQLALQEWIALFEQRQNTTLLNEVARYRDVEANLNTINSSLQRTLNRLTGHDAEEMAALPARQQPTTHLERSYFLQGEIGVDHEQRAQAYLRSLLQFVIELLIIVYVTWFLFNKAKRFVDRRSEEIEMSAAPDSTHKLFALSLGFIAFRVVLFVAAIVLALSRLGFDIGVIVASLGIFGFAFGFAAKQTLSDLIGAITLFVEHSFNIGDVIQISSSDPKVRATEFGRVDSVSWRSTRITNMMDYSINIPNGRVAESVIINYTRQSPLRDHTYVYISPAYETRKILTLITEAVDECHLIRQDMQKLILATGNTVVEKILVSRYEIRWYTDMPFLSRTKVLTELWTRIWQKFHDAGISLEYAPGHHHDDMHVEPLPPSH